MNPVQAVDHAITTRMSARAFLPKPVDQQMLQDILEVARRAPSGTNTQPWKVYVLQGQSRDQLVDKVCAAHDAVRANPELAQQYRETYDYYPTEWVSPYIDRRRENGWSLYGLLGIGKADKDKGRYILQVAAVANKAKAEELQNRLKKAGIKSYSQKVSTKEGERYRIRVGPFGSRDEADKMRSRLGKMGLTAAIQPA